MYADVFTKFSKIYREILKKIQKKNGAIHCVKRQDRTLSKIAILRKPIRPSFSCTVNRILREKWIKNLGRYFYVFN